MTDVTAGDRPNVSLSSGSVAYITTGAPVPEGADAVIKVEDTDSVTDAAASSASPKEGDNQVKILTQASVGQFIRPVGFDIPRGEKVLSKGDVLGAPEIGLLATLGCVKSTVFRKPVVGVMSTGDEIIDPSGTPEPGQIRDSNRFMLLSAVEESGGVPMDLGIVTDREEPLKTKFMAALSKCDICVMSGGVSMGSKDLVKPLLEELGTVHFGRVRLKPGKPTTFATVQVPLSGAQGGEKKTKKCLVFGLPGNPVSALVCFHLFVMSALRKMQGDGVTDTSIVQERYPMHSVVTARLVLA